MRLFIALDIDDDIRRRITEFRDEMRSLAPELRWAAAEGFHITLQFLGETKKLDEIKAALKVVKGPPIELTLQGAGFFPSPKSPRVFWAGIVADNHLQELVNSIAEALKPLGFERDTGPFSPHLTLARAGGGRRAPHGASRAGFGSIRAKLETLPPREFGTMTARAFYLYQSQLSPKGSRYAKLAQYPLE